MAIRINRDIALTYFLSGRKMTTVAILGVLLGISIFIFMNSLSKGFDRQSSESFFKTTAHIRIYKDDVLSKPLSQDGFSLIINPKVVPAKNTIENPDNLIALVRQNPEVTVVFPQVASPVFYNNGQSQITGTTIGMPPAEGNKMYHIESFMVQGALSALETNQNGILVGSGIASKMNLNTGDNISITSSKGVNLNLKVVGIFQTNNSKEDKTKSYVNLSIAQQLLKEGSSDRKSVV